ncbi:hypothetical protein EJB05_45491, partial [Eragrostis curvula]
MEDPTSAPATRVGLPAPPTAATRLACAVYHREQDWRLRIDTMDDTRAPSSTFPVSAPATRAISGGALPPRPSVAPSAKKKRAPVAKKLLLPAATRSTFPVSAPATRAISGGALPPRPSVAPSAKKKRAPVAKKLLLPAATRSRAPPPSCEVPHRQEAPSLGGGLPRHFLNIDRDTSGFHSSLLPVTASAAAWDASPSSVGLMMKSAPPDNLASLLNKCISNITMVYASKVTGFFDLFTDIGDWKTVDPRPSLSQPFTNLLTQDKDVDLQILMQEDATPSKRPPKRGSNYSLEEDIQVCKSWINISNDAVVGTDQPGTTYWERIAQDFHKNKDFESDRSANSIEHRCQTILKECMRFHGYFEEIERCHPSGVPYQEHVLQAQTLYASKNKGKRCPFIDCWLVVRHTEKFAALPGLNKIKRSSKSSHLNLNLPAGSEGDEGVQDTMQAQESSSKKPRPMGRKQSKEQLKRGEGDDDEYKELMKSLIEMKAKEIKQKEEVNQRKMEFEERRLQWKQEEKIMFCDVSKMDEHSKAYVMARRAEIARMAALRANLGESGSVSESGGASAHCSSV